MQRDDITAVSIVTKTLILYDAVMRFIKTALYLSGYTVYQVPGQSALEAPFYELYSGTPDQQNTVTSLYKKRMAEFTGPNPFTDNTQSDQQCPASPQRAPSSSNHRQSIYSDNPNCPPIPAFAPSAPRQVSFRNDTVDIPTNETSSPKTSEPE
jgi:hypothetical protein